jgi:glucose-6-phosphate-specific signal transduction histidine kinase
LGGGVLIFLLVTNWAAAQFLRRWKDCKMVLHVSARVIWNTELAWRVKTRSAWWRAPLTKWRPSFKTVSKIREIHHLVSNALKHAFPGTRTGTIGIDLCREQDRRLSLSVRDDGVGVPDDLDVRCAKSLGLRLVSTLVDQLEGTVEVQRNGGTSFQIIFSDPNMKQKGSSNA